MQHVLVVDDDLPVARALERWLKRIGVQVTLLSKVAELEAVLEREKFTLIICDYLMPVLDGIAVLATARRLAPSTRRCLLSGSLGLVTEAQRESIAPCVFIEKPWEPSSFARQLGLVAPP